MPRMQPEIRAEVIVTAAVLLAAMPGNTYLSITRDEVAFAAGSAPSLINNYFGTMEGLRDALMEKAVALRRLPVIAQGLVNRHPAALAAPEGLRRDAIKWIDAI